MKNQIRFFEEIAANAHVALNVMQYDGWLMRFANGYSGRANSISVLYPSTLPVEEKVAYCEKCYAKQGLPANFKLTQGDEEFSDFLAARGYKVVTPTDLMVCDYGCPVKPDNDTKSLENDAKIEYIFSTSPDEWLPVFFKVHEINGAHDQDVYTRMIEKILVDTIYCILLYDGKPAACSSVAIENGYALLQNVIVSSELRGHGLGKKVCSAILEKARETGAQYAYLQVVQTNNVAVNLYKKLGFEKIYSYWYMKN